MWDGGEVIEPWPILLGLYNGWHFLGRDQNGVTLYGERKEWLAERGNGWSEPGMREAGMLFFSALEGAAAEIFRELHPDLFKDN